MSMSRRTGIVLAGALIAVTALTGCERFVERSVEYDSTESVKISKIIVNRGSGDVIIRPGDPSRVDIHRTVHYRGQTIPDEQTYRVEGTELHINTSCGSFNCGVSYAIRAPEGVQISGGNGSGALRVDGVSTVDFEVGSGDVTIRGATGAVDLTTSSGDVELIDVKGAVRVKTSSGNVNALDLAGARIEAMTESGNVRLELAKAANVRAETSSGDIRLTVPTGDYRVMTDTSSGDAEVRIGSSPNGAHLLDLRTSSGDILVNPR